MVYILYQNFWISFFYHSLGELIPIDYDAIAFIVNNVLFVLSYYFVCKILIVAKLPEKYSFLFFLNPQLIYYSQLINKEAPTLFFVLWITYLVLMNKRLLLIVVTVLAFLMRQQLLIFSLFLYFIHNAGNYRWRLLYAYIISAVGAVLISIQSIEGDANIYAHSGFVKFVLDMNIDYYIGNLFFSPLKVAQWIYDQLGSLSFIDSDGNVDLYKLKDVGVILILVLLGKNIVRAFLSIKIYSAQGERILMSSIIALTFTLLINPIIHARYLFPIEIFLIMLGMSTTEKKRFPEKSSSMCFVK